MAANFITYGGIAPTHKAEVSAIAEQAIAYFEAEKAVRSIVGETDAFRYTLKRVGDGYYQMRVFPAAGNYAFSGEVAFTG